MSRAKSRCGTVKLHKRLLKESRDYAKRCEEIKKFTEDYVNYPEQWTERGIIRIPVVVHVVFNTEEQNISDEQIRSQIEVLNQDFRATNPDTREVPEVWQDLIGDARLQFALANRDPNGNPTNGIIRVATDVTEFTQDEENVKFTATGGSDAWPSDRYLNIWVCPLANELGYATFPGAPANIDGVVIDYQAFGTTGTANPPYNLGRTATHEIGHWLNLFHIWGDDDGRCDGTDEVEDTPNQAGPNFGCPEFPHITCDNGPNGDMFVNYMDYVDDGCMHMFTRGQIARMKATLEGPRSSFLVYEERTDLSLELVDGPSFAEVNREETVNIRVRNTGTADATGVVLEIVLPENIQFVRSSVDADFINNTLTLQIGSLAGEEQTNVSITLLPVSTQLTCLTATVNSRETDQNTDNNSIDFCLLVTEVARITASTVVSSAAINGRVSKTVETDAPITSAQIVDIRTETKKVSSPNRSGMIRVEVETKITGNYLLSNGRRNKFSMKSTDEVSLEAPSGTTVSSANLSSDISFDQHKKGKSVITVTFRNIVEASRNTIVTVPVIDSE